MPQARKPRRSSVFQTLRPEDWNRRKLREILVGFKRLRILVIGDVGVDRYTIGSVERISPEAPVPIVFVEQETHKLGLAANVAENVVALGGIPLLTGVVGKDRGAEDLRKLLRQSKIRPQYLVADPSRRTVFKERIVSERQQLLRVDYETVTAMSASAHRAMLAHVRELVTSADAVILEDYAKGLLNEEIARSVFAASQRAGKIVAVDPNSKSPASLYRGASVLTPNTKEAEALCGFRIRDDESLLAAGRKLLVSCQAQHVVITRGKEGMAIFTAGERRVTLIPTYAREVYDVSGAGDTVISVLTLALASGATIEDSAILGNLAAGVEVGKRGTATVSVQEILLAMDFFEAISE
jgi:rfaE bifunctional protein kinase chain/domain